MILTGPSAKLARQSEQSSRISSVTRPGPSNADLVFANSALVLELDEDGLRLKTVIVDKVILKTTGMVVLNRDSSRIEGGLYSAENQWACELPLDDNAIHVRE
jgi:hypothetical protein